VSNTELTAAVHPFEKRGLGMAPFKFVGSEVVVFRNPVTGEEKAGSTCDYCGTSIANVYHIKSKDGKLSKVGSDCIMSTYIGNDQAALVTAVKKEQAKARKAKTESKVNELDTLWDSEEMQAKLNSMPHPKGFANLTLRDYYAFVLNHSGTAGKLRVLKALKAL